MRSVRTIKKRNILTFKSANESLCFDADEILFFEYCRNKGVKIVTSSVDRYFHCTLHEAFKKTEVYGFAIAHQSFVVNLLHVKSIKGERIVMSNGVALPLAQKRASNFKNAHNQFLQEIQL